MARGKYGSGKLAMTAMTSRSGRLIPESPCPYCGKVMELASTVNEPTHRPDPGDFSLCIDCGGIMQFDQKMRLKRYQQTDFDALAAEHRDQLYRLQRVIREVKAERVKLC